MEATPTPDGAPELTPATSDKTELPKSALSALPLIESPSISPAIETPEVLADVHVPPIELKSEPIIEPTIESAPEPAAAAPLFVLRPRHKRYALLAATVTFAAALGAIVGALATGGSSVPAKPDTVALQESKAMQQSLAKLGKEVTTLKANLDAANKAAHNQMARISEKLERTSADITGSISAPQTAAPLTAPLPAAVAAPLPTPRPRIASIEAQPPGRLGVVRDWTISEWRGGFVFVENHGEIYRVVLGAPLPGLGPVESVKRQDGRWVVTTPRGLIVAMRDRRYFQEF